MLKSPGVWYLATLFASLGVLSALALDALRNRAPDRVLVRDPAPASAMVRAPEPPAAEVIETTAQSAADPGTLRATRTGAFGRTVQEAPPAQPVVVMTPPGVPVVPAQEARAPAPWSSNTVTTPFGTAGGSNAPTSGERAAPLRDCVASWDRETHMTKDEWKAACERIPRRQ